MINLLAGSVAINIRRAPFHALLVVLLVAVGIGATIPMFTVYYHIKTSPVEVKDNRIFRVLIDSWSKNRPFDEDNPEEPASILSFYDVENIMQSDIPEYEVPTYSGVSVVENGSTKSLPFRTGVRVTSKDFFDMLDVPFVHGGVWSNQQSQQSHRVAVISTELNQKLFGRKNSVGDTFTLDGKLYTVVGVLDDWVMVPKFYDMRNPFYPMEDVYLPFGVITDHMIKPTFKKSASGNDSVNKDNFRKVMTSESLSYLAFWVQLPSSRTADYKEFIDSYVKSQKQLGRFPRPLNNRLYSVKQWMDESLSESNAANATKTLLIVGVLFLFVCLFNAVGLVLSKFIMYQRQTSIIRSIGASKIYIFVLYLSEVLALSICGGLLGLLFAKFGLSGINWLFGGDQVLNTGDGNGYFSNFTEIDFTIALVSIILALISGVLAGVYPAWRACRTAPAALN